MAHGYWMITGRPQAVMVHVNVGTANALCATLNAWRENVPLLLMAGRTPIYEQGVFGARDSVIHWGQEMRDQAAMPRECVKWDYELRGGAQLEAVVARALTLATAEPGGPVYLTLPREVIAAPMTGTVNLAPGAAPPAAAHPDPEAIVRAAGIIAGAANPLIIANRAGRDPGVVDVLARFADRFAVPVVEFWANYMSLPGDHPMHLGFDIEPWIGKADAILVLDTAVPWIPDQAAPREDCPIIQIGPDPAFANFPMRGFRTTVGITSNVGAALVALGDKLGGLVADKGELLSDRRARVSTLHDEDRARIRDMIGSAESSGMTAAWAGHCLNEAIDDDTIVVNELGAPRPTLALNRPGSYFAVSCTGGLGWCLPAALGAKLAAPDKLVVATMGDGSYMFANPVVCHQTAQAHDLPILTVVFNNAMWGAVERATHMLYPDGHSATENPMPLTSLAPSPQFEKIVAASGGHGERVDDAAELPAALGRAIAVVRNEGRQALVNIILSDSGSRAALGR